MATNFPTSLDSLTNPTASDKLNSVTVPHATQHSTLNDAVEALEAKVGVDGSAVTTSHDYLIDKQSVVPYADSSARTTAVPSPIEGQMSYLEDTNSVEVYDGSAWTAVGGGGGILQVQSTVKTDDFDTTANGPVDVTGLSVSITPSDASSTILVMVTVPTTGGGGLKNIWIKRDSTDIFTTSAGSVFQWATQSTTDPAVFTIQGIDSPATTSATTYKVQIGTSGANRVRVGLDNAGGGYDMASSITVMEISA